MVIKKLLKHENILPTYRILSWFFTSLFYLLGDPFNEDYFHLIVIFLLLISAIFSIWLYKLANSRKISILLLLIIETVGICALLIPTGTLNSPFIWYAINPVLIAASLLPIYYGWIILFIYSVTSIIAFSKVSGNSLGTEIFEENSHLFLVFILITLAVQLLNYASKQLQSNNLLLQNQRNELEAINRQLKEVRELNDELMLLEEQNRIANEIHDSVSQRLFSITYAIHAMKRNPDKENFQSQLELMEECSRLAYQELRECIYQLSSKKNKDKQFIIRLKMYLEQIAKLDSVDIRLYAVEEAENLSLDKKQKILRIISEAVGNALRHGKANQIDVKLFTEANTFFLIIEDNGFGFSVAAADTNPGLGLRNIKNLVSNFHGQILLESRIGQGTKLTVSWPLQLEENVMEVS